MIPVSRRRIEADIAQTLTVTRPTIALPCDSTGVAVIRDMPISNVWKSRIGGKPKDQWHLRESQLPLCRASHPIVYVRNVICGVRTRLLEGRQCRLVKERSENSV